jgi:hypothetical protein
MRKTLLAFLLFALSAAAMDLTGRWWGEAVTNGEAHPVYISLLQQGTTLTGTGGPSPTDQDVVQHGKIEGNKVAFDVVPGGRSPLHFELTNDGDRLNGTVQVTRNGQIVTGKVSLRKRSN